MRLCVGTGYVLLVICACFLADIWPSAAAQHVKHPPQGLQDDRATGGFVQRISRRLATERSSRRLQQAKAASASVQGTTAANSRKSAHPPVPLTAAGVPARIFHLEVPRNQTGKQHSVREAGSLQPYTPVAGQTFVSSAANPSGNQTAAATLPPPAAAAAVPINNQWYNNQVSGVSYFGRIPGTSTNQSLDGLYPLGADVPGPTTSTGCAEYPYPAVVQYPTVFFTAALQDYGSSDNLGTDEEAAFSAAVNAFLAPTLGDVVSNTSWLQQGHNGQVLCLPSATALLAGGDALRDFFQTTLDKDPNMVFPTAAWGQIITSNIMYRAPQVASELSFDWFASDYGNCSALCGGGIQTRQVACMDSLSNPAAESSCPQPAPATVRPCQTQPCAASTPTDFTLVLGDWSDCNATCGTGSRTRGASCVSSEGYVGSLLDCSTTLQAVAAQTWQACDLPDCPKYIWSYSDWICDNTNGCGGGTAHRVATCIQTDNQNAVNETLCDPAQLDNSTQSCAQAPCAVFFWKARELADCLPEDPQKPCGRYVQRRRFDCVNMTSNQVVPFISCTGPKPDLGDVECPATITCIPGPDGNYIPNVGSTTDGQPPSPVSPADVLDSQTADDSYSNQQQVNGGAGTSADAGSTGSSGMQDTSVGAAGDAGNPPDSSSDASGQLPAFHTSEGPGDEGATTDNSSGTTAGPAAQPPQSTPDSSTAGANATNSQANSNGTNSSSNTASSPAPDSSSSGSGSDPTNVSTGSVSTTDSSNGSGNSGVTVPSMQPVTNDPVLQLGPGQVVPGWLYDNPTPNLQSVLRCPPGRAVNPDGTCCSANNLGLKGNCCDGPVDACGVCNGTGKAIDALGACCSTLLDARGVCCAGSIDECGVCNGQNACLLKAELQASLPTAAIYLMPQSKIKQGLIDTLQSRMADAIAAATGRPFDDKSRLTITLSAYKPQTIAAASARIVGPKANHPGNQAAGQGTDGGNQYPQQSDADSSKFSTSSTLLGAPTRAPAPTRQAVASPAGNAAAAAAQPVFASVVRSDGSTAVVADSPTDDSTQQQPVQPQQADTVQAGSVQDTGQQGSVPSSLVAYTPPATANGWFTDIAAARNIARILGTSMSGLRRLLGAASTNAGPMPTGSSTIIQPDDNEPLANSSNTIIITALLQTEPQDTGLDSGTFMLALYHMVDAQIKVPGTGDTMEISFIKSAERPTVCGDGICQAGERQAVDNPNSCPQDCGLPFLPCPPFNSSVPTCNGRGVCYHSIGSCSCAAGYAGEDCSMCATNYKLVNGFCVASAFIAPPRANSVVCVDGICDQAQTIFSSGSERPNFRKQGYSSIGGIIGITVATGVSVLSVLIGAAIVAKRRRVYLVDKCREKLAHEAQTAQG